MKYLFGIQSRKNQLYIFIASALSTFSLPALANLENIEGVYNTSGYGQSAYMHIDANGKISTYIKYTDFIDEWDETYDVTCYRKTRSGDVNHKLNGLHVVGPGNEFYTYSLGRRIAWVGYYPATDDFSYVEFAGLSDVKLNVTSNGEKYVLNSKKTNAVSPSRLNSPTCY